MSLASHYDISIQLERTRHTYRNIAGLTFFDPKEGKAGGGGIEEDMLALETIDGSWWRRR